jgi:hypothetical protein
MTPVTGCCDPAHFSEARESARELSLETPEARGASYIQAPTSTVSRAWEIGGSEGRCQNGAPIFTPLVVDSPHIGSRSRSSLRSRAAGCACAARRWRSFRRRWWRPLRREFRRLAHVISTGASGHPAPERRSTDRIRPSPVFSTRANQQPRWLRKRRADQSAECRPRRRCGTAQRRACRRDHQQP